MKEYFAILLETGDFVTKRTPRFGKTQSSMGMSKNPKNMRLFDNKKEAEALIEPIRIHFGLKSNILKVN
jgi:hypothetical protein